MFGNTLVGAPILVKFKKFDNGVISEEWINAIVVSETESSITAKRLRDVLFPNGKERVVLPFLEQPHMWKLDR